MDRITGRPFATRSEVLAPRAMAATSQPLATQIALHLLREGGSAVDAAIGASAALALMEPTGAGLGGDLFAMAWDEPGRRLCGLNASGRSPRGLSLEHLRMQVDAEIPATGPLPVSVPGCVDGWFDLHARFGRLPMARVLAPTIEYARQGFPVSQVIAWQWARGARALADEPGFAETFLPDGRAPAEGASFRNPGLAATLELLASSGRDVFYRGEVAERIDRFARRVGCALRTSDFEAHASEWVEPVSVPFAGCEVHELPPNGQGLAVLQMLRLLETVDLVGMGWGSAAALHHLIEAKKIVYEDRARLYADPAFARAPVDELLSLEYAARRRGLLSPRRASRRLPPSDAVLREGDTVYLATADAQGNMVSLIQSNYRGFGSGLCPDGLGFCLQDRGQLFALEEGHANVYAPGKRPFHTIIPGFVTRDGRPTLAFGVMGGDMQPQGHVQILINHLLFDMNLQEAGDAPRWYHTGSSSPTGRPMLDGGRVALERGLPQEVARDLVLRGHQVVEAVGVFGGYQAIARGAGPSLSWRGASESRKDGHAAGF